MISNDYVETEKDTESASTTEADSADKTAEKTDKNSEKSTAEGGINPENSLQKKLEEAETKYLYLYSEFENFRRRVERDKSEFIKFGHEGFLKDLLQVLDNFERAISHAKTLVKEKGDAVSSINQGVEMIHYQLLESLKNQGVEIIATEGKKFDPNFHEALSEEESEKPEGEIIREARKGYMLYGRLLRASGVVLSKGKK
ncbi:MAG: nucleotide exchange factor GrpE [Oligoflexia bacterium]|nr:nucleotide exchange factor GrpE [Oligoflexia bacterium]